MKILSWDERRIVIFDRRAKSASPGELESVVSLRRQRTVDLHFRSAYRNQALRERSREALGTSDNGARAQRLNEVQ